MNKIKSCKYCIQSKLCGYRHKASRLVFNHPHEIQKKLDKLTAKHCMYYIKAKEAKDENNVSNE